MEIMHLSLVCLDLNEKKKIHLGGNHFETLEVKNSLLVPFARRNYEENSFLLLSEERKSSQFSAWSSLHPLVQQLFLLKIYF